ncbi:hypothetical protein [Sphingobacterium thalpophilum]|uniref:hypothetical protein n=1 Tax=Sphingobacterium thalpophilum TaxID=259 RepID=UPI002D77DB39|nr:hypothetical protein [Sphingobacterium thalpophilum]
MNPNFFLIYTVFALLTIMISLFILIRLARILKVKTQRDEIDYYNGIVEVGMLIGCGILFFDVFPAVSTMLSAMDMQQVNLYDKDIIKLLFVYEGVTLSSIIIAFLCSRAVFIIVKRQFKEELTPILFRLFFAIIFIVMIVAVKPVVVELLNYFQPTIKTPFFR